jgi:hypothetical protein
MAQEAVLDLNLRREEIGEDGERGSNQLWQELSEVLIRGIVVLDILPRTLPLTRGRVFGVSQSECSSRTTFKMFPTIGHRLRTSFALARSISARANAALSRSDRFVFFRPLSTRLW